MQVSQFLNKCKFVKIKNVCTYLLISKHHSHATYPKIQFLRSQDMEKSCTYKHQTKDYGDRKTKCVNKYLSQSKQVTTYLLFFENILLGMHNKKCFFFHYVLITITENIQIIKSCLFGYFAEKIYVIQRFCAIK